MALKKAICPYCEKQIMVNNESPDSICGMCRKSFPTVEGLDKYNAYLIVTLGDDATSFPFEYRITIEREFDTVVGNDITVILMINGRPHPLASGGYVSISTNEKNFEIPFYTTDHNNTKFEGVFRGIANGRDIRLLWRSELQCKTLGRIVECNNPSVALHEKPGSCAW